MMEAVRVLLLLLGLLVQVFGAPVSTEEDLWTVDDWQGYPPERAVSSRLADLIRRSPAQHFHGLMGRSSGASQPVRLGRKRNKGETFFGLMGKRTLAGDVEEDSY